MFGGKLSVVRVIAAIAGLLGGPLTAFAVPVTWEAQGSVASSDLGAGFFASFAPRLAGTQKGDGLVLQITFDPDAAPIGQGPLPHGGTAFLFDASSLMLTLEVTDRGMHVFTIDDMARTSSRVLIADDFVVTREPGSSIIDSLQFSHIYQTEAGADLFSVFVAFSSEDTSIFNGGSLPRSPDPRLSAGINREIFIFDAGVDGLLGTGDDHELFGPFSSLVRVPTTIPEPGSLALLCLGLAGLRAVRRDRADSAA
jgi:hypothetical protein